jgi:dephospho-CoA kinase
VLILGLTGGIACGKSLVSAWLQQQGAAIIDADAVAHTLMRPGGSLYMAYLEHFGNVILQPDGTLDRQQIGRMTFGKPEVEHWLNATAHPVIRAAIQKRMHAFAKAGHKVCVLDVPLLYEAGWDRLCDYVCVVWTRQDVQLQRLMSRNGYSKEEALVRVAAQMPQDSKKLRANYCLDNNGSPEATLEQAAAMWEEIKHVRQ